MKNNKQQWKEGTVQEFLGFSDADMAVVENNVALALRCGSRGRSPSKYKISRMEGERPREPRREHNKISNRPPVTDDLTEHKTHLKQPNNQGQPVSKGVC